MLSYYDPHKKLTLEIDAFEYGSGTVLILEERPVAYSICSLSETESGYAQIGKGILAVVYGLETFHHYRHGRKVNVFIDHKPLVSICQKPLTNVPKRLQNLHMHSQQYDFSIKCKQPIDALSQAPTGKLKVAEFMIRNNLTMHPIIVGYQRLDPRHWTTFS